MRCRDRLNFSFLCEFCAGKIKCIKNIIIFDGVIDILTLSTFITFCYET